jgi:Type IV secretion system pilin
MFQKLFFLILASFVPAVHAAMVDNIQQPVDTISLSSPSELVVLVIRYTIGIAGILWVIGITWGGIQMILSVGEDEKQKKARYMIIYSVLWVIIAWLAYSIVNVLSSVQV